MEQIFAGHHSNVTFAEQNHLIIAGKQYRVSYVSGFAVAGVKSPLYKRAALPTHQLV